MSRRDNIAVSNLKMLMSPKLLMHNTLPKKAKVTMSILGVESQPIRAFIMCLYLD